MNDMITHDRDQEYDRYYTQAEKLRTAINYIGSAKKLIPRTLLVMTAEAGMIGINDDFDALTTKLSGALGVIDDLLDEMEQE